MVSKRRSFLKNSSILAGSILLGSSVDSIAAFSKELNGTLASNALSILHTSGLSGSLNPVAGPFGGLKKVNQLFIRRDISHLILDSGNFLQQGSQIEDHFEVIRLMNKMGYRATTIGKNELSMGQEQLAAILPALNFELVNCNYNFSHTTLSSRIKPYIILNSGKIKIGITGVGNCSPIAGVQISEPFQAVNQIAKKLKRDLKCDFVICLTQFSKNTKTYNDKKLAEASEYVDLIIGGELGKVIKNAYVVKNQKKYDVLVSQAGSKGKTVGELTYEFNQFNTIISLKHKYSISGMSQYASLKQKHEVFQLLTAVV
jgi:5'-nucleotidase